jgi:hypothetical protein
VRLGGRLARKSSPAFFFSSAHLRRRRSLFFAGVPLLHHALAAVAFLQADELSEDAKDEETAASVDEPSRRRQSAEGLSSRLCWCVSIAAFVC